MLMDKAEEGHNDERKGRKEGRMEGWKERMNE